MLSYKKILILLMLTLIILITRDLPYVNVFIIDKVWMIYLAMLFLLYFPTNIKFYYFATGFFIFLDLLASLIHLPIISEILGILIFILLWILLIFKIKFLLKVS